MAFDPRTDVTWDVLYWADDPSWSNPGDGGAVSTWRDASGNGRDITQATGTSQPAFRAAVPNLNNAGAVEFVRDNQGAGDRLDEASGWTRSQPYTIVAVVSAWSDPNDGTDTFRLFSAWSGSVQAGKGYPAANEVVLYAGGADWRGTSPATTADLTSANLFTFFANGASSAIGKNGTVGTVTASPGTNPIQSNTTVGVRFDGWQPSSMKLALLGVYNGDFTADGNYTAFKTWAASFYGLTIAGAVPVSTPHARRRRMHLIGR